MPQESKCEPKISVAKANRKIAKPIMEKKRRARINASLNELKTLLVEVLQKEGCRHSSKMEKADILEMAVRHLKNLQKHQAYPGTATHTLRDSYPPAIPLEKYATSLPAECLPPEIGHFMGGASSDRLTTYPTSPDSSTGNAAKLDANRNILPAPQPINISALATGSGSASIIQPMMTRTANGELAVVLPQHLLKQANSNGLLLPIYTVPQQSANSKTSPNKPVMISISTPLQQSQNSAFSQMSSATSSVSSSSSEASHSPVNHPQAPVSPVWRPW